jgi:hypothetical protein
MSHRWRPACFCGTREWLLQRLLLQLCKKVEAQDVASETFVRILHTGQLVAIHEPRAYLMSTAAKSIVLRQWWPRDLERACISTLPLPPQGTDIFG